MIYNEGSNFSLGANLGLALFAANIAAWGEIEKLVAAGQKTYKALKYAPFPVVAAPAGMALGGGCEIVLHADAVQAHAETYIGLVECGVGLIPGWGGCGEMLARWRAEPKLPHGPMPAPAKVFEGISTADVSKSAHEAMEKKFLRRDRRHHHEPRPSARGREAASAVAGGRLHAAGAAGVRAAGPVRPSGAECGGGGFHRRGIATDHDLVVADALAEVLSRRRHRHYRYGDRATDARPGAEGVHAAGPHRANPGADRAHAGDRQAVAQLGCSRPPASDELATNYEKGTNADYKAPLRDMRFVLHELHDSAALTPASRPEESRPS